MNAPVILGIETSCDETGIGIVSGQELLVDEIASSVDEHARFGGVVPEIASRAHLEAIMSGISRACSRVGMVPTDLDAIAVTAGPGLAGALLVGTSTAQGLAWALDRPVYAVNHLAAHVAVDELVHGDLPSPCIALLVSGGHTSLLLVDNIAERVVPLGATLDDAAGEAFDKVARLLGLGFPGGPEIDRHALTGDRCAIDFPRGLSRASDQAEHAWDFSFSGLKTAVARWVERAQADQVYVSVPDVAASFQEAVVDVLVTKALKACAHFGVNELMIGGGVAANSRLRAWAIEQGKARGVRVRIPPARLCTDNGAMVAALGSAMVRAGMEPSPLDFPTRSTMPIDVPYFPPHPPGSHHCH